MEQRFPAPRRGDSGPSGTGALEEPLHPLRRIRRQPLVLEDLQGVRILEAQAITFQQGALADLVCVPGIPQNIFGERERSIPRGAFQ